MPEFVYTIIALVIVGAALVWLWNQVPLKRYVVRDIDWALYVKDGQVVRVLKPGVLWIFGKSRIISYSDRLFGGLTGYDLPARHEIILMDKRQLMAVIPGQELLTQDTIGLKLSMVVVYRIADPVIAYQSTDNYSNQLYTLVQLGLREAVAATPMDTLLEGRDEIAKQVKDMANDKATALGLALEDVAIRDIMLSKEVRQSYAAVVLAKKEGQAALERARGESAALRNLANGAQALKNNPELMQLRLIQAMSADDSSNKTFVMGVPAQEGAKLNDGEGRD